jgi:hypothetical protein
LIFFSGTKGNGFLLFLVWSVLGVDFSCARAKDRERRGMEATQLRRPQMRPRGDDLSPGRDPGPGGREKETGRVEDGADLKKGRSKKHESVLAAALVLLKHSKFLFLLFPHPSIRFNSRGLDLFYL